MAQTGASGVLKAYFAALLATILFPLQWLRSIRLAARHSDDDPKARTKVLVAIVLGIGLCFVGVSAILAMQESATDGMYDSLGARMQRTIFEQEYIDQGTIIAAKDNQIPIVEGNIARREANLTANSAIIFPTSNFLKSNFEAAWQEASALRPTLVAAAQNGTLSAAVEKYNVPAEAALENWTLGVSSAKLDEKEAARLVTFMEESTGLPRTLAIAHQERTVALARLNVLEPNHQLNGSIAPKLAIKDDVAVMQIVQDFNARGEGEKVSLDATEKNFAIKDKAVHDMMWMRNWFLLPSTIGLLFAPLVFATGNILRKSFVPSETVGFKQYPGASMGCFLLLGGFGVPALFMAAWTFMDMESRSTDGQINL